MDSTDEGHILTEDQARAVPDLNDNAAEIDIAASVATSTSPTIPTGAGQPLNPPVVISNNDPKFKYKYPQARPTPEGVDDSEWNKLFTAADSRFYNKANKNAVTSKAKRESGETYELALQMLQEKREKAARKANNNVIGSSNSLASSLSTAAPKTKISNAKKPQPSKEVLTSGSREATPATMDMAERIKTEARPRKAASDAPSEHNSPAPSPAPKIVSSAAPLKPQKTGSKKGTATSTKKQQAKKSLSKSRVNDTPSNSRHASHTPGPKSGVSSGDESNDGGEYCICRGPDDHRMMVFCEGGCEDWYHCSCVGIDEEDAKELLDRFICPMCNIPNKAFTTFKPICRYHNVGILLNKPACRKAARAASDPPSKYCCDEHREAFWDYIVDRLREDDESSKGGTINQVEASDILNQSRDIDQFRALGEKPRLPKKEGADPDRPVGLDYLLPEEVKMLEDIKNKKTELQRRVRGYQNQHKLFRMVLARAKLAAQHLKETKPLCGYDNRMAFNEVQFEKWSKTTEGKTALETGILGPRTDETKHIDAHVPYDGQIILEAPVVPDVLNNICLSLEKSRCKHNKLSLWKEVHSTDLAYNMTLLNEQIDKLTMQEAEIIDDAETREATKGYYADNTTTQLF